MFHNCGPTAAPLLLLGQYPSRAGSAPVGLRVGPVRRRSKTRKQNVPQSPQECDALALGTADGSRSRADTQPWSHSIPPAGAGAQPPSTAKVHLISFEDWRRLLPAMFEGVQAVFL